MRTDAPRTNPINGVATAIVRDNRDPDGLARVRVSFPWYSQPEDMYWARLATPMTGNGYGMYFLPEVNDEVLVAFERGDLRFPYIVGSLWNGNDKPPVTNADGRNDIRTIRTRKGHALRFEDGAKGRLRLELNDGKALTIDDGGITIDGKGARIVIDGANNAIAIESGLTLRIRAPQISVDASGTLDLKAGGTLTLRGSLILIN